MHIATMAANDHHDFRICSTNDMFADISTVLPFAIWRRRCGRIIYIAVVLVVIIGGNTLELTESWMPRRCFRSVNSQHLFSCSLAASGVCPLPWRIFRPCLVHIVSRPLMPIIYKRNAHVVTITGIIGVSVFQVSSLRIYFVGHCMRFVGRCRWDVIYHETVLASPRAWSLRTPLPLSIYWIRLPDAFFLLEWEAILVLLRLGLLMLKCYTCASATCSLGF